MTKLESAPKGIITPEMIRVALRENVTPEFTRDGVARGLLPGRAGPPVLALRLYPAPETRA